MTANTETKVVPVLSSGTAGPLGALHLPRLWLKLTLGTHNALAEGYDFFGGGFDQMTVDALGLKKDDVIAFVRDKHPSYIQFEEYVAAQNGGSVPQSKIDAHNAAIRGYNHSDELGAKMRAASGIKNANVKDAVTLNTVEDLDDFHAQIERAH
jgi:hypothetical protein